MIPMLPTAEHCINEQWETTATRHPFYPATDSDSSSSSDDLDLDQAPEIFVRITTPNLKEVPATPSFAQLTEEVLGLRLHELLLRLATLAWLISGLSVLTNCGERHERLDLIGAVYLIAQLVTTVGYGDVHPTSNGMQLFMSFYCVIGNVLTALVITERLQKMINRTRNILSSRVVEDLARNTESSQAADRRDGRKHIGGIMWACCTYLAFILLGAIYYGVIDNCICPSDYSQMSEFSWDRNCEDLGGHRRNFIGGLYMACVTLTTVGFGDELPSSKFGRVFGIFWMLFGVASMMNFVGTVAHMVLMRNMQSFSEHGMTEELFRKIDQDGSGTLTRFEFVAYMLVKCGVVAEYDLDMLISEFEHYDKDKSGELTYEEICQVEETDRRVPKSNASSRSDCCFQVRSTS